MSIQIQEIDGKIVEAVAPDVLYIVMLKKDGAWQVGSWFYHSVEDAQAVWSNFNPEALLLVKIQIPKEML